MIITVINMIYILSVQLQHRPDCAISTAAISAAAISAAAISAAAVSTTAVFSPFISSVVVAIGLEVSGATGCAFSVSRIKFGDVLLAVVSLESSLGYELMVYTLL